MTVEHDRSAPRRSGLHRFFLGLAIVAAALASLQPALGAFAFFRPSGAVELDTIHFVVGGLLYNAVLVMAILVFFTRVRHRWPLVALCVGQYVLVHLQLRLGLGSNDDPGLLAFHVPVGVLILVVSYAVVGLAWPTWRQRPCHS